MRPRAGFTLTELLISIVVIALVFTALAMVYPSGIRCLRKSSHTLAATTVAQQTMEQFQQQGFANLVAMMSTSSTGQTTLPPGQGPLNQAVVVDGVTYDPIVTLSLVPGSQGNLLLLQVAVLAETQDAIDDQPVTLSTQVFNFQNPF